MNGTIVSLWRYPVKSLQGEELNASEVSERGLAGDRGYALVDQAEGKVASAKNPKKWPNLFAFRAAFVDPPHSAGPLPAVRLALPDGTLLTSGGADTDKTLSRVLGRQVSLHSVVPAAPVLEEYWPDMEGLTHRDAVTNENMPQGTFFDLACVHLLTTATIDRLRELHPQGRFEVRRFRPNIVVAPAGEKGFVENNWIGRTLALGDSVRLKLTGPCPRCVMTTLPQADLPHDPGILRTAVQRNEGHVGVYASVTRGGTIRAGDAIRLQ
jgi:uncharacterized protein YcbX